MPPVDPVSAASLVVPTIGAIGSSLLQRKWALKDWHMQNEYNSPKAQVARLKEAGLPLATMFGGQGGSTSSDVQSTNVDPTMGSAKGLEAYMQNRMQKKQAELIDAQILKTNQDAQLSQAARDKAISEKNAIDAANPYISREKEMALGLGTANTQKTYADTAHTFANIRKNEIEQQLLKSQIAKTTGEAREILGRVAWLERIEPGNRVSNQSDILNLKRNIDKAGLYFQNNQNKISDIEKEVKQDLHRNGVLTEQVKTQLDHLFLQNDLMRQTYTDTEHFNRARHAFISSVEDNPGGLSPIRAAIMALLLGGGSGTNNLAPFMPRY